MKNTLVIAAFVLFLTPTQGVAASSLQSRVEARKTARLSPGETPPRSIPRNTPVVQRTLEQRINARRARREQNTPSDVKEQVAHAVNMERAKMGLAALVYNKMLASSAQAYAADMFRRDFFSHESPEGQTSTQRIQGAGYGNINAQTCRCTYRIAFGENLAKGQTTVTKVLTDWMNSPTHREAILSRDFKDIGVGITGEYWVLHFGGMEITHR